jgi:uncharacterized YigZ family protein
MLFDDTYYTIRNPIESVFRDRGSKFLGYAYPFTSESDLKSIINGLKKEHPKANHHCFAYRLGTDRNVFRVNDDGEPTGTAGRPILNQLYSKEITNALIVVVRYFGGTLLGVPGLINAYGSAAKLCIEQAEIVQKHIKDVYEVLCNYEEYDAVLRIVKQCEAELIQQELHETCKLHIGIRKNQLNAFINALQPLYGIQSKYIYTY